MSWTPELTPLRLSHLCAIYLQAQFQFKLNACLSTSATPPDQPLMLPVPLALELDIIAATLVDAFFNCSQYKKPYVLTCWMFIGRSCKVGCYALCSQGAKKPFKIRNKGIRWQENQAKTMILPTGWSYSLSTMHYYWHAGYYIDLVPSRNLEKFKTGGLTPLSDHIQKSDASQSAMLDAWKKLSPLLNLPKTGSSWHEDTIYFQGEGPKGSVNLSPAWFQQGHDVSTSIHKPYSLAAHPKSGNIATIPKGFCKLQKGCCIGLARCHLRVQCNFQSNPGSNPPQTLRRRLGDYQAPGGSWDMPLGYSDLMGVHLQQCCRHF